jgi:hypothetical protein
MSNKKQGMSNVEGAFTSTFDIPCSLFDIAFDIRTRTDSYKKGRINRRASGSCGRSTSTITRIVKVCPALAMI